MAFMSSSKDIYLEDNHILHATCQKKDGTWVDSKIDLDDFVGNENGKVKSKTRKTKGAKGVPRGVYIERSELFRHCPRCSTRQRHCSFVGAVDQEGRRTLGAPINETQ